MNCKASNVAIFSPATWEKIDAIFKQHISQSHIPEPIKTAIRLFSKPDLCSLLAKRIVGSKCDNSFTYGERTMFKIPESLAQELKGCLLSEKWDEDILDNVPLDTLSLYRTYPTNFQVIKTYQNCAYFFDKFGGELVLITILMRKIDLPEMFKFMMRRTLIELFDGHQKITRAIPTLHSHMTGFGPHYYSQQLGGVDVLSLLD